MSLLARLDIGSDGGDDDDDEEEDRATSFCAGLLIENTDKTPVLLRPDGPEL